MKTLRMEFFKCKRRKLWLAPLLMLAAQLAWGLYSYLDDMSAKELLEGWPDIFYSFPLLNAMMTPVIAAVVASRIADIEHKGQTLKLLETVQPAGRIFDTKFICAAFYMTAMVTLQTATCVLCGVQRGFVGAPPVPRIGEYYISTLVVTLTILLIQLILSLLIPNQMVGMILGLIGSFLGLFSLFFPPSLQRFLVWAYYGVLVNTAMDWNETTRVVHYHFIAYNWSGFVCICLIFLAAYCIGRRLFVRREV